MTSNAVLTYTIENHRLTPELAEFIGIVIGDGNLYRFPRTGRVQITGHRELDWEYYNKHVLELINSIGNFNPKIKQYTRKATFTIDSLALYNLMKKRFGIPSGPKAYIVCIPDAIMESDVSLRRAVLRGLFDTDGGVGFDKRTVYKKPYVRVNFTTASIDLIQQISRTLKELAIPHSLHARPDASAFQIQINGPRNVKKFVDSIGFANPRHTTKLKALSIESANINTAPSQILL